MTLVPVSSSWVVQDGVTHQVKDGRRVRAARRPPRPYQCRTCGQPGHNSKSCGKARP